MMKKQKPRLRPIRIVAAQQLCTATGGRATMDVETGRKSTGDLSGTSEVTGRRVT